MYIRKIKLRGNWLVGLVTILCLTLLSVQSIIAQEYGLGDIPLEPEVYQMHIKDAKDHAIEAVDLPTAYDARDDGIVTPAKNQGACGSCWAFALVGAMESHMLKEYGFGPTDLSEQQQVSCNTSMWGCGGGNASAIQYWEDKGPLYESCFPYTAIDSTPCAEDSCDQLAYRVLSWYTVPVTTADFKTSLYVDGPSYWRFTVYNDFFSYWSSGSAGDVYVNAPSDYEGGHAVLLIGWDDSKGAFLCKNSWGTTGGPNNDGTFWIAYSGHSNNLGLGMINFSLAIVSVCGDGICDPEEDRCTCPEDCGAPDAYEDQITCDDGLDNDCDGCLDLADSDCGGAEETCTGNIDDDCDDLIDCADPDCAGDPACICDNDGLCEEGEDCHNCPDDCIGDDGEGCNNDGVCEPLRNEDCNSCPSDCRGMLTGKPSGRYCCGENGTCGSLFCNGEGWLCSDEGPSLYCCGNGLCEEGEDMSTCAIDCGACSDEGDCDDFNECTQDSCIGSVCVYEPRQDDAPCTGGICCSGRCTAPDCSVDGDCVDSEACTTDTCVDAGTCSARCDNVWPECNLSDGCCGPSCTDDPDCPDQDCSDCLGGVCDGKCHPVKDGPGCPDCTTTR